MSDNDDTDKPAGDQPAGRNPKNDGARQVDARPRKKHKTVTSSVYTRRTSASSSLVVKLDGRVPVLVAMVAIAIIVAVMVLGIVLGRSGLKVDTPHGNVEVGTHV
jgi:hypothetical protein